MHSELVEMCAYGCAPTGQCHHEAASRNRSKRGGRVVGFFSFRRSFPSLSFPFQLTMVAVVVGGGGVCVRVVERRRRRGGGEDSYVSYRLSSTSLPSSERALLFYPSLLQDTAATKTTVIAQKISYGTRARRCTA